MDHFLLSLLCRVEQAIIHASMEMSFSVSIQRWKCVCLCQLSGVMMRNLSEKHYSTVVYTFLLGGGLTLLCGLTCLCSRRPTVRGVHCDAVALGMALLPPVPLPPAPSSHLHLYHLNPSPPTFPSSSFSTLPLPSHTSSG